MLNFQGFSGIAKSYKSWYNKQPGDVVTIPAEVKHWHGAKAASRFSHLAVECPDGETSNEWLEPVTDEVYSRLAGDEKRPFCICKTPTPDSGDRALRDESE